MGDPNLVTTCNFHGQEYLFKMNILCNNLEILVTDKSSGEEWQCSYDAIYIENLTQKTGNFKQFEIFVAMIKSGLLRTSESVTLDLLTFEDLELLRSRKITKTVGSINNNRRYLIVTYVVEFDKIRYPLPLEYCGPPDPIILQATIRKLEVELCKTKEELAMKSENNYSKTIYFMRKRIDELTEDNIQLQEEVRHLTKLLHKKPRTQVVTLHKAVSNLEKCVVSERNSHHELVDKLKNEKDELAKELAKLKWSEKNLKSKLSKNNRPGLGLDAGDNSANSAINKNFMHGTKSVFKRNQSPAREFPEVKKDHFRSASCRSKKIWDQFKKSDGLIKGHRSKDSSCSSTKYMDPTDTLELYEMSLSRSPSPSPRKPKTTVKSRCSSADSRTSSRGSSRGSSRPKKKDDEYKKLEDKIANLQKLFKASGLCAKNF